MLLALMVLAVLIPYFIAGANIERKRFAVEMSKYHALGSKKNDYEKAYEDARHKRNQLKHKSYCYLNYEGLSRDGCSNCIPATTAEWKRLTRMMEEAKNETLRFPEPRVDKSNIFGWPIYLTGQWVRSGEVDTPESQRIKELEEARHQADLAELKAREARALDRMLEG